MCESDQASMKTILLRSNVVRFAFCLAVTRATPLWADLARDTQTARIIGEEGHWVMENALQLEKDKDGKTWTFETGIQYTPEPFPRLQLLVEPTFWERDEPKDGPAVSGIADTDFTVAYVAIPAQGPWPPVIVAGKVKFPTASDREIGTGKVDYSFSLITGREFGELDVGLELEYERFGDPPAQPVALDPDEIAVGEAMTAQEVGLKDQLIYTLSADYGLTENLSLFVEIFGNTAPTRDQKASNAVGAGFEYDIALTKYADPFISVEFDTDELFTAKIGVEWNW